MKNSSINQQNTDLDMFRLYVPVFKIGDCYKTPHSLKQASTFKSLFGYRKR